jgi:AcrR family transcriptional regulator
VLRAEPAEGSPFAPGKTQPQTPEQVQAQARDRVVRHLGGDDRSSTRVRIVDGALRCLARQGLAKTTVDDIAREASLSRATVYRTFPRGKDGILAGVVETEVARLFSGLAVVMGEATDLEDVLVAGMVETARRLRAHEALNYLLTYEPGVVLPYLTFAKLDRVLLEAADLAAPFFARWLEPEQASRAVEWAGRIVLAYLYDAESGTDLVDPVDAGALVRAFVLPGILALRVESASDTACPSSPDLTPSTHPHPATTKGAVQ